MILASLPLHNSADTMSETRTSAFVDKTTAFAGDVWVSAWVNGTEVWGKGATPELAALDLKENMAAAEAFDEDDPIDDWKRATGA